MGYGSGSSIPRIYWSRPRRINDLLADPPYPIELTAEPDAEWSEYFQTLKNFGV